MSTAEHEEDEFFEPEEQQVQHQASSKPSSNPSSPIITKPIIQQQIDKEPSPTLSAQHNIVKSAANTKALFDDVSPTPQASNVWGSWGSSLSSFVNVAQSTLAKQADRLYESLDPEYEREKMSIRDREARTKALSTPLDADAITPDPKADTQQPIDPIHAVSHAAEALLSKMDEGLNSVSDAVGNSLFSGYKKIEEAKIGEKVLALQNHAANHEMLQQSRDLSQDALSSGLAALEGLGQQAMNFFGSRPTQAPTKLTKQQTSSTKTFSSVFNESEGGASFIAIESLSTSASSQVTTLISKSSKTADMKDIDQAFDVDSMLEDAESISERPFSDDKEFDSLVNSLKGLTAQAPTILTKIKEAIRPCESSTSEKLRFFNVLYEKKLPSDTTIEEFIDGLYLDALAVLVSSVESWCTLVLRVAESQLMSVSETSDKPKAVDSVSEIMESLRTASIAMINVINETAEIYSSAFASLAKKFPRESVATLVDKAVTILNNDGESAITVIQESFNNLSPIFKFKRL
ncbi:hypothetical protein SmJEL517_g02891 [Synchytrium microbalum]|uniref:Uncharacterized protein n=1 Tax=Synchytrium microbalum TaxID=1806994 RepID=A0A507C604_9FUNG|nr:uncharacterized protein SmJEL517_g02891 [Synchytrium microbalum]TPX34539.1 hypothetical protein SmJEL517_g02891 [Synchytrium microbalum]